MKILFLNVWEGEMKDALRIFLTEHIRDTDICCFQESDEKARAVYGDLFSEFQEVRAEKYIAGQGHFSLATYIRHPIPLLSSQVFFETLPDTGLGLYTEINVQNHAIHICNFHGIAQPPEKLDTPGRLQQSSTVLDFLKDKDGLKIIGGDFNLMPEVESLEMFRRLEYRDLIKDSTIETTRNRLAWDRYPGNKQYYSDYVFVSDDTKVTRFSVPQIEVSDHLPLILTIEA